MKFHIITIAFKPDKERDDTAYWDKIRKHCRSDKDRIGKAKANIIVAVIGVVVVANTDTAIAGGIVPTTPAENAVGAFMPFALVSKLENVEEENKIFNDLFSI